MTWVLLKKRGGDDIAVNLNHVVSIEPIQRAGQDPAAILTTVQVNDDAKRQRIELETSFRKLVNLVGATAVDPPPPDYTAALETAQRQPPKRLR